MRRSSMHSYSVVQRITEYSNAFAAALALAPVESWASELGYLHSSDALRTVFPLPISAAGYSLLAGDIKFRDLGEAETDVEGKFWTDGVAQFAERVEMDAFSPWGTEPQSMALEASRHPQVLAADCLVSNPYLDLYRIKRPGGWVASTRRLFATDHPYNVLDSGVGSFSNMLTTHTSLSESLFRDINYHFRSIKGANGRPLGLRFSHVLAPPTLEEDFKDWMRAQVAAPVLNVAGTDNVAAVLQENRHRGFKLQIGDELEGTLPSGLTGDTDTFYAFGSTAAGTRPWPIVISQVSAPEQIIHDKTSDMYKRTLKIGVAFVLRAGYAAGMPQAILKVDLSP